MSNEHKIIMALCMLVMMLVILMSGMSLNIINLQGDLRACHAEAIAIDETKNGILLPPQM